MSENSQYKVSVGQDISSEFDVNSLENIKSETTGLKPTKNNRKKFDLDLAYGQMHEDKIAEMLQGKKIEVKTDFKANETGNVFIEYESRGKKSGIATSLADYYCIAIGESFHIMKPELLKKKCRKYLGTKRDVLGGDNNTSKGILLPVIELV